MDYISQNLKIFLYYFLPVFPNRLHHRVLLYMPLLTGHYHKRALLYVVQAAKVATKRGSKTLSLEDLLFLMRHSPVKVWQNLNTVVEKFLQDDFSFAAGAKVGEVPDRP